MVVNYEIYFIKNLSPAWIKNFNWKKFFFRSHCFSLLTWWKQTASLKVVEFSVNELGDKWGKYRSATCHYPTWHLAYIVLAPNLHFGIHPERKQQARDIRKASLIHRGFVSQRDVSNCQFCWKLKSFWSPECL